MKNFTGWYELSICVPLEFTHCKPNLQCDGLSSRALGRQWGCMVEPAWTGSVSLGKTPQRAVPLSPHEDTGKWSSATQTRALTKTLHAPSSRLQSHDTHISAVGKPPSLWWWYSSLTDVCVWCRRNKPWGEDGPPLLPLVTCIYATVKKWNWKTTG